MKQREADMRVAPATSAYAGSVKVVLFYSTNRCVSYSYAFEVRGRTADTGGAGGVQGYRLTGRNAVPSEEEDFQSQNGSNEREPSLELYNKGWKFRRIKGEAKTTNSR
jgi:hypothetical protein